MKFAHQVLVLLATSAILAGQTPPSSQPNPAAIGGNQGEAATAPPPAIVAELDRLQGFATRAAQDIAGLRIESWKTNSAAKSAAQANADAVHRNLTAALPGLIEAARAAPDDVNAEFKLYRNVIALYDPFDSLTDSTRILGQKSQYEEMAAQLKVLGSVRRNLGEQLEELTALTQSQLNQMRHQIKDQEKQLATAKAEASEAREQVMLAQAELAKKAAAAKKKSATKKAAPAPSGSNSSSTGANGNGQAQSATSTPKT